MGLARWGGRYLSSVVFVKRAKQRREPRNVGDVEFVPPESKQAPSRRGRQRLLAFFAGTQSPTLAMLMDLRRSSSNALFHALPKHQQWPGFGPFADAWSSLASNNPERIGSSWTKSSTYCGDLAQIFCRRNILRWRCRRGVFSYIAACGAARCWRAGNWHHNISQTPHASRRVVGQWGGAGGAVCE